MWNPNGCLSADPTWLSEAAESEYFCEAACQPVVHIACRQGEVPRDSENCYALAVPVPTHNDSCLQRLLCATLVICVASCAANTAEIRNARIARYHTDKATIVEQTRRAVAKRYPRLEGHAGEGWIRTAWYRIESTGRIEGKSSSMSPAGRTRVFVRFHVVVSGGGPWQVRVTSEASEWPAGLTPRRLRKVEEPPSLEGRTNALRLAIHKQLEKFAGAEVEAFQSDSRPTALEHAAATREAAPEEPATVYVQSKGSGIQVAALEPGGTIVARDGSNWRPVCVAPCSFKIKPGEQVVMVPGFGSPTKRKLTLEPGESVYLVAKPPSQTLATTGSVLALAGLVGVLVGTGAMALSDLDLKVTASITGGGVAGMGLGFGLISLSDSSLETTSAPKSGATLAHGISLLRAF